MTKLWDCRFKGKNLAVVHNAVSKGLGTHQPDTDAIRAALPHYCKHMEMAVWSVRPNIGESYGATVQLRRKNGTPYFFNVTCTAYDFDPATNTRTYSA